MPDELERLCAVLSGNNIIISRFCEITKVMEIITSAGFPTIQLLDIRKGKKKLKA